VKAALLTSLLKGTEDSGGTWVLKSRLQERPSVKTVSPTSRAGKGGRQGARGREQNDTRRPVERRGPERGSEREATPLASPPLKTREESVVSNESRSRQAFNYGKDDHRASNRGKLYHAKGERGRKTELRPLGCKD